MRSWKYVRSFKKLGLTTKILILLAMSLVPCLMFTFAMTGDRAFENNASDTESMRTKAMSVGIHDSRGHVRKRFKERRENLQRQCDLMDTYFEIQNSENAVKEHLTIDKKHKLVYCSIEKIGCTFWKRVFQILSGFRNVTNPFHIQGIRAYEGYLTAKGMPFDRIYMILKQYTKFMFVREPYERLLSGYVDKLFAPNAAYWSFIGTFITQNFRPNATERAKMCGNDVTFSEFVRYFIHSQHNSLRRDAHFVPNFEHCRPCEIAYEYIGKLETFEEDTLFLLKELKLDKEVIFDDFQHETERDAITDAADYVFSMKRAISRCMPMNEALFRAYRKLQIRGIINKNISFPFVINNTTPITIEVYKDALFNAYALSGSTEARKVNREEAFLEAYASLPHDLMMKLKDDLKIDAELFGYEVYPESFRNLKAFSSSFEYFKI